MEHLALPKVLKRGREVRGWSAAELARRVVEAARATGEELSLTQQAVSLFESGKTKSTPRWVSIAASLLKGDALDHYIERTLGPSATAAVALMAGATQHQLDAIANYLKGNAELVLSTQHRDQTILSHEDAAKLRVLENATEEQFVAIADYMRGRVDAIDASAAAAQQLDAVLLPEIDVAYSMGGGSEIEEYPVTQLVPLSRGWLATLTRTPASELFVARGEGDSMQPTILDGDIVIVDRSERALRGQDRIWAVAYGNFGMIKRLRSLPSGALQINSDNPAVSPIEAFDGEAHIIGRVVGVVRRV